MAESKTYTVSTITRGMCLETRPNNAISTGTFDSNGNTHAQLWTIEQSEDQKLVAFRNVADGQYLRGASKGDGAKVQTGAKSWWTLQNGDSPGSWWLRCNETENYLNNYCGYQTPNNTVQMWSSNLTGWNYTLQWYINDAKPAPSFSVTGGGDAAEVKKQKDETEATEKALKEREEALSTREKELLSREAVTKKQKADFEAKESTLSERQQKLEAREQAVAGKEAGGKKSPEGAKDVSNEQTSRLQQRIKELEDELASTRTATPTAPAASTQQERQRLKPIVIQKGFGFLPRLTDAELNPPSNTPLRTTSVR